MKLINYVDEVIVAALEKTTNFWHRLSPADAHKKYCIPQAIADGEGNAFYTNCDSQVMIPADVTCKFIALVANRSDAGLTTFYPGNFSLSDLFDLYGYEVLESGDFNLLDVISGLFSLKKDLSLGLVTVLEGYAAGMSESETISSYVFQALDEAEIERYRISIHANYIKEVYRCIPYPLTSENQDVTTLVSFSRRAVRPTVLGMAVTQFSEREFQNTPKFNVFINGRGCITLTKKALLELTSMLKERAEHLVSEE